MMKRVFSAASSSSSSSSSSTTLLVVAVVVLSSLQSLLAERRHGFELNTPKYTRKDFPAHFVFGSGTSAYQVEGAAAEDGRTPSIWDTAAHTVSGKSQGNGDVACDQYHKYKEDVKLMVDTGLDAYRFSISWSRIIPNGRGSTNLKGLQYYNNLINELLRHGIQPHVTLSHYDLPQVLEDEYGGWLSRNIVNDFTAYADVCFREFGDRVSHWTTINEANSVAWAGYDLGITPPKRCSAPFGINCTSGNSTSEPYIVAHNCLLAHASAARLYKRKYQANQHGHIGLNILVYWFIPLTNITEDILAIQRANDIFVGWFIDPLVFGDYPDTLKKHAVSKLPSFTQHESHILKDAYDFVGVNYYMTAYAKDDPDSLNAKQKDILSDMAIKLIFTHNGTPAGEFPLSDSTGMQSALEYFKQKYGNPPIYIHENGQRTAHKASLIDTSRVKYLDGYIASVLDALRNGSDTRGYFTWSFLDLYELLDGYKRSFGLYYVDFNDPDLTRYPKLSALWYSNFLKGGDINIHQSVEAEEHIFQATI